MIKAILLSIAILMSSISLAHSQVTPETKAEQQILTMLKERDADVKEVMGPKGTEYTEEQKSQLKELINGIIFFENLAEIALQETFHEISPEKREEFINLFASIIRDQSLAKLDIYRADVIYNTVDVHGDSAYVKTTASLENVTTPVSYEMLKVNGDWMIGDMIIDDVSTAESYQRSFQRIINRNGFDALLGSLRKRAERS
jgi:phospholipid transport system substrate-binding protein